MTQRERRRMIREIVKLHYSWHQPTSLIDQELALKPGTARDVINGSWAADTQSAAKIERWLGWDN